MTRAQYAAAALTGLLATDKYSREFAVNEAWLLGDLMAAEESRRADILPPKTWTSKPLDNAIRGGAITGVKP